MDAQLEAIKEAVEAGEIETARTLSDTYVAANSDLYTGWETKTIDGETGLVANIDVYRATGRDDDLWHTEAWLLHRFMPQNIGGAAVAQLRVPNSPELLGVSRKKVSKQ